MIKNFFSYLLVLLLIILVVLIIILLTLQNTILNENYIYKSLEKSNYYNETYNNIIENFKNNTIQSGLTEEVVESIISREKVKEDINKTIRYMYDSNISEIEILSIKDELSKNIQKEIEENNKVVTDEEKEDIEQYKNVIDNIYKNGILYNFKIISNLKTNITKYKILLTKIFFILIVALLINTLSVLLINKKNSLKFLSISSLASGILLIIINIAKNILVDINNILILNKAFSYFIIVMIKEIFKITSIFGIILFLLGIVLSKNTTNVTKK